MRCRASGALGVGFLLVAGLVAAPAAARERVEWGECADLQGRAGAVLECATLQVPMARSTGRDAGEAVTLALSRVPARAERTGTLVVNPGGPGSAGRTWASVVASRLPDDLRDSYDVVGFDPRGVGASTPTVTCDPGYFEPVRPDPVPADAAAEKVLLERSVGYAQACGDRNGALLDHMATVDSAHDIEAVRHALGAERIDYLGYSYGTYLGGVYATLYPDRVRGLVLDSVVNPDTPWYQSNLIQSRSVDAAALRFFDWVARHDGHYGLGATGDAVRERYYAARASTAAEPLSGTVGPAEFESVFVSAAYTSAYWPPLADALSGYALGEDPDALLSVYDLLGEDADSDPGFGAYLATQCADARWPRDWSTWRVDAARAHAEAPFIGWNNIWYNAPCLAWPGQSREWFQVDGAAVDGALLIQATDDGPTPVAGAYAMRARFPAGRLIIEDGGVDHGVSFGGNACVDEPLAAYLRNGTLPAAGGGTDGADLTCAALAEPEPQPRQEQAAPEPAPRSRA